MQPKFTTERGSKNLQIKLINISSGMFRSDKLEDSLFTILRGLSTSPQASPPTFKSSTFSDRRPTSVSESFQIRRCFSYWNVKHDEICIRRSIVNWYKSCPFEPPARIAKFWWSVSFNDHFHMFHVIAKFLIRDGDEFFIKYFAFLEAQPLLNANCTSFSRSSPPISGRRPVTPCFFLAINI